MERLIYDADGNVISQVFRDDTRTIIHTTEDVTDILEDVKRARDDFAAGPRLGVRTGVPIAKVPRSVVDQAIREGWMEDNARWMAWFRNPDNAGFRVFQGNL